MNATIVSGILFASLVPAVAALQQPNRPPQVPDCANVHAHEPLIVYEVSGATLSGTVDRTLIVFADGVVKLASAEPGELGRCAVAQVTSDAALQLHKALDDAGAATLCDDEGLYVDLPLHTLTMLRGAHDMRGRTFSYWNVSAGYAGVDAVLEDFVANTFRGS